MYRRIGLIALLLLCFRPVGAGAQGDPLELVLDALLLKGEAAETQDLTRKAELLGEAEVVLSRVVEDFPTSEVARLLSSGQGVAMSTPHGEVTITLESVRAEREMATAGAAALAALDACAVEPTRSCVLAEALAIARTIEYRAPRQTALEYISEVQAEVGFFEEALSTAADAGDRRAGALRRIAVAQVRAGFVADALAIADTIWDLERRAAALRAVAVVQAEVGDIDEALAVARRIEDRRERIRALVGVAAVQGDQALLREMSETAREIEEPGERAYALSDVAVAQARAGHTADALGVAREIDDRFASALGWALLVVAEARGDLALYYEALAAFNRVEHEGERASAQREVAVGMAQAGFMPAALSVMLGIRVARHRNWTLVDIVEAHARAGRFDLASEAVVHIDPRAGDGDGATFRSWALRAIARGQAQAGLVDDALTTARGLSGDYVRAVALGDLAVASGRPAIVGEALALVRRVEEPYRRDALLKDLAVVQAETGNVGEALATVVEIEDMSTRARAMAQVARHISR